MPRAEVATSLQRGLQWRLQFGLPELEGLRVPVDVEVGLMPSIGVWERVTVARYAARPCRAQM